MIKLFLKLYAAIGIPFGVFMGLLDGADHGWQAGVKTALYQGVFFGAFCAWFLAALHRRECRKIGGEILPPVQTLTLELLSDSPQSVYKRLIVAVRDFGAVVEKSDPQALSLSARVRSSWRSFGEVLQCRVTALGESKFEIEIVSRPRFRSTLVDYGKGRLNVEGVARRLATR